MDFAGQLALLLPPDIPNRETVLDKAARHLELIVAANRQFNLTRITDPREAAIKHVLDSILPWRIFAEAKRVLDAGTGAGFPGIPLAIALPAVHFVLSESIGKKARFVDLAIADLKLANVTVAANRAEDILQASRVDVITARAVAPILRALELFGPALRRGSRLLLYKGPDARAELVEARQGLAKWKVEAAVVASYDLPDAMGARTIVELRQSP